MKRQVARFRDSTSDTLQTEGRWDDERQRPLSPVSPPTRQAGRKTGIPWEVVAALLVVAALVAGGASLLVLELWLAGRVMPGVYVWDLDLGGLDREQAMARLETDFQYPEDRYPTLYDGDRSWHITLTDLAARMDVEATVDLALSVGHRGELLDSLREQLRVLLNGYQVKPVFTADPGVSAMFLSQIAREVNQPLRNATLEKVVPEGQQAGAVVEVVPGQVGREVDESGTRRALLERIAEMSGGVVPLVVIETEPWPVDLDAIRADVGRFLSAPVALTAPDHEPWRVEQPTLAGWLVLRPNTHPEGQVTLKVGLDSTETTLLAQMIAGQIDQLPVDAAFRFNDAEGELVAIVESEPGQKLDVTATVALLERAAASAERTVSLPILTMRPALATEDASSLGIVELVAEGVTSFAGSSASRVQNISVGASQFDGLLIAPGETFSFNYYLGEVTAERGYEESIIIWGNTTRADVGGGLCQVSSTAFRAAFWAGVPITERVPHAFRVSYYEPPVGMDATIYSPSVDLKWENDTGHHLLIETYVDRANSTLTFRYYGTKPDRTVKMDGPYESNPQPHGPPIYRDDPTLPVGQTKQIEWAKDGLDVAVYRVVKEDGVEVRRDTFFSRYRPWQAVYLVGTKTEE